MQLVVVGIALGDRVGRGRAERVVVRDVCAGMMSVRSSCETRVEKQRLTGSKTADKGRGVRALEHLGEELRSGVDVGGPAQPASVSGIHVHVHADRGELVEGVGDAGLVGGLGIRALLDVQVRDEVRERVGLDDSDDADVGELLDLRDDLVDVVVVLLLSAVGDAELAVRRLGRAITVREIVHNDLHKLLLAGALLEGGRVREVRAEVGHLRDGVKPGEGRDFGHAGCLCTQRRIRNVGGSSSNLSSVVGADVSLT